MEKGNNPLPHECRRLEKELEDIWELNNGKYKTFCGRCHIRKLTLVIGIVDICIFFLLITAYVVSMVLVDYIPIAVFLGVVLTFAFVCPLLITNLVFACLLVHGVRKEHSILLTPYLFKSFGLSLNSLLMGWFAITQPNLTNIFYLVISLLHIYITWIVWRCFKYFIYKQVWHQINSTLTRANHNFHNNDVSVDYSRHRKAPPPPYAVDIDSRMLTNGDKMT